MQLYHMHYESPVAVPHNHKDGISTESKDYCVNVLSFQEHTLRTHFSSCLHTKSICMNDVVHNFIHSYKCNLLKVISTILQIWYPPSFVIVEIDKNHHNDTRSTACMVFIHRLSRVLTFTIILTCPS